MNNFILKNVCCDSVKSELENIGFDKSYLNKAVDKYNFKNIKIFNLSMAQAIILKQTAISVGADCAVHRETITGKVDTTDCLLGGSFAQLKKIAEKLKKQPFSLAKLADLILSEIDFALPEIVLKNTKFDFSRPYLVGVLNLTKDSFSDGGEFYEFSDAVKKLDELIHDGADIIEMGAESTKPFSSPVCADAQLEKLLPILNYIKEQNITVPISIDTRSAQVARECIRAGADIINDVSGFDYDFNMVKVLAEFNVPIIIQHSLGTPENMQNNPSYENLIDEIYLKLDKKINFALENGISRKNIIVDPGIGFGKTKGHNFEILDRINEFQSLQVPVMVGLSRKSLLAGKDASNDTKDIYSLALNSRLIGKNVNFLRVHNVKLHRYLLLLFGL